MIKRGTTKSDRSRAGRSIRKRGNNYEVQLAWEFRELGWSKCVTARAESRNADALKQDLMFTNPYRIQAKCRNCFSSPVKDLAEMPQDDKCNLMFQKVVGRGEYVTLAKEDLYKLIKIIKNLS